MAVDEVHPTGAEKPDDTQLRLAMGDEAYEALRTFAAFRRSELEPHDDVLETDGGDTP